MILRSFRKVADNLPNRKLSMKEKRHRLRLELLEERRRGKFISLAEGRKQTERMIARKKAALRKAKA